MACFVPFANTFGAQLKVNRGQASDPIPVPVPAGADSNSDSDAPVILL